MSVLESLGKTLKNAISEGGSNYLWSKVRSEMSNGVAGNSIREALKNETIDAIERGDQASAKEIMQNLPVLARSSGDIDDLSRGMGKFAQITPANNVSFYATNGDKAYTTLLSPESAVTKAGEKNVRLLSPQDTGLSNKKNTLQEYNDYLKANIGGTLGSTTASNRKELQDFAYKNIANNFEPGELTYSELATPRENLVGNDIFTVPRNYNMGESEASNNAKHGSNIANYAYNYLKGSKDKSKAFDNIFITGAPIALGVGSILGGLLGSNNEG